MGGNLWKVRKKVRKDFEEKTHLILRKKTLGSGNKNLNAPESVRLAKNLFSQFQKGSSIESVVNLPSVHPRSPPALTGNKDNSPFVIPINGAHQHSSIQSTMAGTTFDPVPVQKMPVIIKSGKRGQENGHGMDSDESPPYLPSLPSAPPPPPGVTGD